MITRCHAQVFVGVVTYTDAYHLLSTYYLPLTVISACAYYPDSTAIAQLLYGMFVQR